MFKKYSIERRLLTVLTTILLIPVFQVTVSADTTEDVYKVYGQSYNSDTKIDAKTIEELEEEYNNTVADNKNKELIYKVTQDELPGCETELVTLDLNIYEVQYELRSIEDKMNNADLMETRDVLGLVSAYQQLVEEEEELLTERGILTNQFDYLKLTPNITKEDKQKEVEIKERIKVAKNDIGEVLEVKHPLNNKYFVTSQYGYRMDPVGLKKILFHSGLDMRAAMGTEVLSIFNGTVERVTMTYGGGKTVWIDHGQNIKSVYMHLSDILVQEGQKVKQYDIIAKSGNTGASTTGPHLHFGLYLNGNSVDPEKLFK